jgi:3D (Asp-Asp-Asp) domain-containing protein
MATSDSDRWFVCDDRGGALDTERKRTGVTRLDLRFRDHADAIKFGRKFVTLYLEQQTP